MKKLLILASLFVLAACQSPEKNLSDESVDEAAIAKYQDYLSDDNPKVEIFYEGIGSITVQLFEDTASNTTHNYLNLVRDNFYDGLIMHRVIKDFMIQGGDPLGNGTGGADTDIYGEFKGNGFDNNLSHTRGVISMARSSAPNSASSQFFIVHQDSTFLDGSYAGFGAVVKGFDTLDKIANMTTEKEKPVTDVKIEKIKIIKEPKEIKKTMTVEEQIKFIEDNKEVIDNTTKPSYIHNPDNPVLKIQFNNELDVEIELYPEFAPNHVNSLIKSVNDKDYLNIENRASDLLVTLNGKNHGNYLIQDELSKLESYKGALGTFSNINQNGYVYPNSGSQQLFILKDYVEGINSAYTFFGFMTKGLDEFLKLEKFEITKMEVELNAHKYEEPKTIDNQFSAPTASRKASNPKYEVGLSNGESFKIELFENISPVNAKLFTELDIVGLPVDFLLKDQVVLFNKGVQLEGKQETNYNLVNNLISNDKYTMFMVYGQDQKSTVGQFGINLSDNSFQNSIYGVFGYIYEGQETIDSLNSLEVDQQAKPTTSITITSFTKIN